MKHLYKTEGAIQKSNFGLLGSLFCYFTSCPRVCPITNQAKDYAFEVPLPEGLPFIGVVLTDQLKNLDVRKRKIKVVGSVPIDSDFMKEVLRNTRSILA